MIEAKTRAMPVENRRLHDSPSPSTVGQDQAVTGTGAAEKVKHVVLYLWHLPPLLLNRRTTNTGRCHCLRVSKGMSCRLGLSARVGTPTLSRSTSPDMQWECHSLSVPVEQIMARLHSRRGQVSTQDNAGLSERWLPDSQRRRTVAAFSPGGPCALLSRPDGAGAVAEAVAGAGAAEKAEFVVLERYLPMPSAEVAASPCVLSRVEVLALETHQESCFVATSLRPHSRSVATESAARYA